MARINIAPYLRQFGESVQQAGSAVANALYTAQYNSEIMLAKTSMGKWLNDYLHSAESGMFDKTAALGAGKVETGDTASVQAPTVTDTTAAGAAANANTQKKTWQNKDEMLKEASAAFNEWVGKELLSKIKNPKARQEVDAMLRIGQVELEDKITKLWDVKIANDAINNFLEVLDAEKNLYMPGSYESYSNRIKQWKNLVIDSGVLSPETATQKANEALEYARKVEVENLVEDFNEILTAVKFSLSDDDNLSPDNIKKTFAEGIEAFVKIGVLPASSAKTLTKKIDDSVNDASVLRDAVKMITGDNMMIDDAKLDEAMNYIAKKAKNSNEVTNEFSAYVNSRRHMRDAAWNEEDEQAEKTTLNVVDTIKGVYKKSPIVAISELGRLLSAISKGETYTLYIPSEGGTAEKKEYTISFHGSRYRDVVENAIGAEITNLFKINDADAGDAIDTLELLVDENFAPTGGYGGDASALELYNGVIKNVYLDPESPYSAEVKKKARTLITKIDGYIKQIGDKKVDYINKLFEVAKGSKQGTAWAKAWENAISLLWDPSTPKWMKERINETISIHSSDYDRYIEEEYKEYLNKDAQQQLTMADAFISKEWEGLDPDKKPRNLTEAFEKLAKMQNYRKTLQNRMGTYKEPGGYEKISLAVNRLKSTETAIEEYITTLVERELSSHDMNISETDQENLKGMAKYINENFFMFRNPEKAVALLEKVYARLGTWDREKVEATKKAQEAEQKNAKDDEDAKLNIYEGMEVNVFSGGFTTDEVRSKSGKILEELNNYIARFAGDRIWEDPILSKLNNEQRSALLLRAIKIKDSLVSRLNTHIKDDISIRLKSIEENVNFYKEASGKINVEKAGFDTFKSGANSTLDKLEQEIRNDKQIDPKTAGELLIKIGKLRYDINITEGVLQKEYAKQGLEKAESDVEAEIQSLSRTIKEAQRNNMYDVNKYQFLKDKAYDILMNMVFNNKSLDTNAITRLSNMVDSELFSELKQIWAGINSNASEHITFIMESQSPELHMNIRNIYLPENGVLSDSEKTTVQRSIDTAIFFKELMYRISPELVPAGYKFKYKESDYINKDSNGEEYSLIDEIKKYKDMGLFPYTPNEALRYIGEYDSIISAGKNLIDKSAANEDKRNVADEKKHREEAKYQEGLGLINKFFAGQANIDALERFIADNQLQLGEHYYNNLKSTIDRLKTNITEETKGVTKSVLDLLNEKTKGLDDVSKNYYTIYYAQKVNDIIKSTPKNEIAKAMGKLSEDINKALFIKQFSLEDVAKNDAGSPFKDLGIRMLVDLANGKIKNDPVNNFIYDTMLQASYRALAGFMYNIPSYDNVKKEYVSKLKIPYKKIDNIIPVSPQTEDAVAVVEGAFPLFTFASTTGNGTVSYAVIPNNFNTMGDMKFGASGPGFKVVLVEKDKSGALVVKDLPAPELNNIGDINAKITGEYARLLDLQQFMGKGQLGDALAFDKGKITAAFLEGLYKNVKELADPTKGQQIREKAKAYIITDLKSVISGFQLAGKTFNSNIKWTTTLENSLIELAKNWAAAVDAFDSKWEPILSSRGAGFKTFLSMYAASERRAK